MFSDLVSMHAGLGSRMFRLEISGVFSAAHAIMIKGEREPLHGHDWHVTVVVEGEELDEDGLLVDFHMVEGLVRDICGRFHHRNLNDTAPFDKINPTAELVAKHLADTLQRAMVKRDNRSDSDNVAPVGGRKRAKMRGATRDVRRTGIPPRSAGALRVASVRVTEAVGCAATYVLPRQEQGGAES